MKNTHTFLCIFLFSLSCHVFSDTLNKSYNEEVERARKAVSIYQTQLKAELQSAIKQGGLIHAVSVCNKKSPEIAQTLSKEMQLTIKRVSLKPRNLAAKANIMERSVLGIFAADDKHLTSEIVLKQDKQIHYYQPIHMQGVCLNCHGNNLEPKLAQHIRSFYPKDQATGYSLGDLRGAFSVKL